jgi:hypothetical protein
MLVVIGGGLTCDHGVGTGMGYQSPLGLLG